MSQTHKFDTVLSQAISKLTCKLVKTKKWKIFGIFQNLVQVMGSLIERGLSHNFGAEGSD